MTDKTREAIKAEVIGIINRNPADSFDMDGCVNRLASLITAQADGVTDEPAYLYAHGIARVLHEVYLQNKDEFVGGDNIMDVLRQIDSMIHKLTGGDGWVTNAEIEFEANKRNSLGQFASAWADGAKWLRSKLAAPKQDGWIDASRQKPPVLVEVILWHKDKVYLGFWDSGWYVNSKEFVNDKEPVVMWAYKPKTTE